MRYQDKALEGRVAQWRESRLTAAAAEPAAQHVEHHNTAWSSHQEQNSLSVSVGTQPRRWAGAETHDCTCVSLLPRAQGPAAHFLLPSAAVDGEGMSVAPALLKQGGDKNGPCKVLQLAAL